VTNWTSREERLRDAKAHFERVVGTPSPDPAGASSDAGVLGFVFGELWGRGVLTSRDRRWITLCCVAAAGGPTPIRAHVESALNSGEITYEEFDEFVLFVATQLGWPKGSALAGQGALWHARAAEERGEDPPQHDYERWADPVSDDVRRARGQAAYRAVHAAEPPAATTAFRGRAYLDYLYGELWTRDRYLTRRERRMMSICCAAAVGVDVETSEHLRAALSVGELSYAELQELVLHFAGYQGSMLARHLDELLLGVAAELGIAD
jgi:4-carboxymuconolactone decarboxylase